MIVCSYLEPVRMIKCQSVCQSMGAGIREQFVRSAGAVREPELPRREKKRRATLRAGQ